jgi:hypothetical protein
MFKLFIEKFNELGLIFIPNLFIADFEQTIHNFRSIKCFFYDE